MDAGKITEIKQVGSTYRISISDNAEPIAVPAEIFTRYALKPGLAITEAQAAKLREESALVTCDNSVARLLGIRDHSVREIKKKLALRSFSRKVTEKVVNRYIQNGLLDDAHFAASYVRMIIERNPMGRSHLILTLEKKGIAHKLAEQVVETILKGTDELTLAVRSLRKRWSSLRQLDIERAREKAYTYLSRRGIGYASARQAFEQLLGESEEE